MQVVIIGGGSAGVSAATHLRRIDENAEITIIEKSGEFAVSTCGLPYVLSGKVSEYDDIVGATVAQMQRIFQINVKLNTEVLTINPEKKEILLSDNKTISYDKLIIATGSLQLRPDIKGILNDNIFSLNSLLSAIRISDFFKGLEANNVLVLGGGYIGLRAAEALVNQNANVIVVENNRQILSGWDEDFAQMVKQKLETRGLSFFTQTSVKEFLPNKALLTNGEIINFDMAIVATGNKSTVKLPIMSNIEIGESGGIKVNEFMQTSVEDIFACGENIEIANKINGMPMRLADAALVVRSAKTAADNLQDPQTVFKSGLKNYIVKLFDYVVGFCGCNEKELKDAKIAYHKLYFAQSNGELYTKNTSPINCKLLFGYDGKILGFQIFGKRGVNSRLNTVAGIMSMDGNIDDLANLPVAYFPEFAKAKDLLNNLGTIARQIAFEKLKTITLENLTENDILLNVCMPSSFRHFTKARVMNIPLPALRSNLNEIPRRQRVALSCTTGYTAYIAYCLLKQRGFNQIFLLNTPETWM